MITLACSKCHKPIGDTCYCKEKQGLLDYIETLIAGEMLIAHKENQPTSRLTSLAIKIKSKLK